MEYQPDDLPDTGVIDVEDDSGNVTAGRRTFSDKQGWKREHRRWNPNTADNGTGRPAAAAAAAAAASETESQHEEPKRRESKIEKSVSRQEKKLVKNNAPVQQTASLTAMGFSRSRDPAAHSAAAAAAAGSAVNFSGFYRETNLTLELSNVGAMEDDVQTPAPLLVRGDSAVAIEDAPITYAGCITVPVPVSVRAPAAAASAEAVAATAVSTTMEDDENGTDDSLVSHADAKVYARRIGHLQPFVFIVLAERYRVLCGTDVSENEFRALMRKLCFYHSRGLTLSGWPTEYIERYAQYVLSQFDLPRHFDTYDLFFDTRANLQQESPARRAERVLLCTSFGLLDHARPRSIVEPVHTHLLSELPNLRPKLPEAVMKKIFVEFLSRRDRENVRRTCRGLLYFLSNNRRETLCVAAHFAHVAMMPWDIDGLYMRCKQNIFRSGYELEHCRKKGEDKDKLTAETARRLYFDVHGSLLEDVIPESFELTSVPLHAEVIAVYLAIRGIKLEREVPNATAEQVCDYLRVRCDTNPDASYQVRYALDAERTRVCVVTTTSKMTPHQPLLMVARIGIGKRKYAEAMEKEIKPYVVCFDVLLGHVVTHGLSEEAVTQMIDTKALRSICGVAHTETLSPKMAIELPGTGKAMAWYFQPVSLFDPSRFTTWAVRFA